MPKARTLTADQQERVLIAADAELAAIMALSFHAGARVSTLAAADWSWFLDAEGVLSPSMAVPNNGTKGGRGYTVGLSEVAFGLLEALWIERDKPKAGPVACGRYNSFEQRHGNVSTDALRMRIKALYKACGLDASSHSGRRSCAGRLLAEGATAFEVQAQLGHASIGSTVPYVEEAAAKAAAERTRTW